MYIKNRLKGFTLVELIVVITILAILGTIGFISLQGYAKSSRESVRVSDLATIAKSLSIYRIKEGYYPNPTDSFDVTFSGSLAWNQGVFGEATRSEAQSISQVPLDPLTKNPYAYSITNTKQEYELGAISESLLGYSPIEQSYAANNYYSFIKGNYNQKIVSVLQPSRIYILGVPTIISSEIQNVTIQEIFQRQTLAINKFQNIPGSYNNALPNGETLTGSVNFIPGNIVGTTSPILYEGNITDLNQDSEKIKLGENIRSYYQDSNLNSDNIVSAEDVFSLQTGQELSYVNTLITGEQGGLSDDFITVNQTPVISSVYTANLQQTSCGFMTSSLKSSYNGQYGIGQGFNQYADVALRSDGSIESWGFANSGETGYPTGTGFVKVFSTSKAFAALKEDGSITAWGDVGYGGTGAPIGTGFINIYSTKDMFTASRADGSVVSWGATGPSYISAPADTGYVKIYANLDAFLGVKNDGTISEWGIVPIGNTNYIDPPSSIGVSDKVYVTVQAFSILRPDGSIYAWGAKNLGGNLYPTGTGYTQIFSGKNGLFVAMKADGSIKSWGNANSGGIANSGIGSTGSPTGTGFSKIKFSNDTVVALKSDGSIRTWGYNGTLRNTYPTGTGFTDIIVSDSKALAVKADGSIVQWGYNYSSDTPPPTDSGYVKFFQGSDSFAALKSDGSVKSWGSSGNDWDIPSPTDTGYVDILVKGIVFYGIKANGEIILWGSNYLVPSDYDTFKNINGTLPNGERNCF